MLQYIDKDALIAWIENQTDILERNSGCSGIFGETQMAVFDRLYSFLDTLEVKEVDLKKEIKSAIVAEIKRRIKECDKLAGAAADNNLSNTLQANELLIKQYTSLLHFIDTIEVKEIHEDIDLDLNPIFEEFDIDPDSRFASMFKESFYKGIDKYLNKKEDKL